MDRNKTSVVVLFILAGFFFIAVAMVFNATARRNAALLKKSAVEEKIASLNAIDLTIYWIGDVPSELETLKKSMTVLRPEEISKENMPVKASTFRITVKDESGAEQVVEPRHYSEYMLIVINNVDGLNDTAKEALRDSIVDNGVPVLCLGGKACNMVGTLLIHGAGYSTDYSMFYRKNEGYEEPYIEAKTVSEGGLEFADALCGKLCTYFNTAMAKKRAEVSELISSANSSAEEAATATTAESSETVTETTEKIKLLKPPTG